VSRSLYARISDLPLEIEDVELEHRSLAYSEEFTRAVTVIHLHGAGHEGVGEDVTYDPVEHDRLQETGPALPLAGRWTIEGWSRHLDGLALFPGEPEMAAFRDYRRWAFESAALDLALRQAGASLAEVLERTPRPVRFVTSRRLPDPATADPILDLIERVPGLEFKLDPTPDWSEELIAQLHATGRVRTVDLKGHYEGSIVDVGADADLYRRVIDGFPDAWIEDPRLTADTRPLLAPVMDRVTWDAPIHSVADITGLEVVPRTVNMKPSRFGPLRELLAAYDHLERSGIRAYGGGQSELGPGRGQIQYLAALFHPDEPNDVAPGQYNLPVPPAELPSSPLPLAHSATGFRWG
jgi:hypothetical protein